MDNNTISRTVIASLLSVTANSWALTPGGLGRVENSVKPRALIQRRDFHAPIPKPTCHTTIGFSAPSMLMQMPVT
ncbi:MAG: hypothetical protein AAB176_09675 [Pseudomonadota bacterium]|jgi:hypothetical protein